MRSDMSISCALTLLLASCAAPGIALDGATGRVLPLEAVAEVLAGDDVVLLGELHDNDEGHRLQARLVRLLHERRPELIVSMEMFERDVQPWLDRYLAGEIDEEVFLAHARPWKNYRDHYRPVVEYAKRNGLRVIAANVPDRLAKRVSREVGGLDAIAGDPHAARRVSAPRDAYWDAFQEAMRGHMGVDEAEKMYRFYQAQCLRDDTMAEAIVAARRPHRATGEPGPSAPLVVHLCGRGHSDFGRGTASRVREREPGVEVGIVTMRVVDDVHPGAYEPADPAVADFVLLVPK